MLDLPFANYTTYPGHSGVDFPYRIGTPVLASGGGTVQRSGWINSSAGYGIDIAYDNGPTVLYCHFKQAPSLRTGARVHYAETIGLVGSTGNSTGPHLHLEIMVGKGANTYAGVWNYFSKTNIVNLKKAETEYPEMFIAIVKNSDWYMVIGDRAFLLGAGALDRNPEPLPIIEFKDDWALAQARTVISGI